MATNPQYVRLPERLLSGNVTDVVGGSGWGISGFDVKEFPDENDDPVAYAFVKDAVRAGLLEEASTAEFKSVQKAINAVSEVAALALPANQGGPAQPSPWNEAAVSQVANKHRRRLVTSRLTEAWEEDEGKSASTSDGEDEPPNYGDMHKAELQAEARRRGLDESGNKDDIVARLEEDDAKATA